MFDAINYFLISQFIWSFTFGLYHLPLTAIGMFLLFKFWERMKLIPSLVFTLLAQVITFVVLFVVVKYIVIGYFHYEYMPTNPGKVTYNQWFATLSYAATCIIIQWLFFIIASLRFPSLHLFRSCLIVLVSHLMSAIIMYKLLPSY